jgi:hypothetical protein
MLAVLGPAHGKLAPAAGVPAPPDPPVAAAPAVPPSEPHPTPLTKPKNRTIASLPEAIERIVMDSAACVPDFKTDHYLNSNLDFVFARGVWDAEGWDGRD